MTAGSRAIEDLGDADTVVDLVVGPRLRSLEGLLVNRVWPIPRRRLIGPFVFLDHLQPAALPAGAGLDVPPHPHIGLATVTYLFDGALMHADSTGVRQEIRPGALNWMTAGRGITHSERSTPAERERDGRIHGVQAWVALPRASERREPGFEHVDAADLPRFRQDGADLTLIAGKAFGQAAPVRTESTLFYLEARLPADAGLDMPLALGQRGIYIVDGSIVLDGREYAAGRLLVLADGRRCQLHATRAAHLMLLGGEPLDGERHIWWNFVASDPAAIAAAREDWAARRFPPVPGDSGYMPLPEA